jgi:hypothetical protein
MCMRIPLKESGIQVLAGLAPSNQTAGSLLRTSRAGKASNKNSAKSEFGEFTLIEKYAQLLLIERIRQSQIFDKPSHNQ